MLFKCTTAAQDFRHSHLRDKALLSAPAHNLWLTKASEQVDYSGLSAHLDAVSPVRPVDASEDDGPPLAHRGLTGHEHCTLQALA